MCLIRGRACIAYGANSFNKVTPATEDRNHCAACTALYSKTCARQRFTVIDYTILTVLVALTAILLKSKPQFLLTIEILCRLQGEHNMQAGPAICICVFMKGTVVVTLE